MSCLNRGAFAVVAGITLAVIASQASAVYKCESPGKPPTYQDDPCPPAAQETKIGAQSQRDRALDKAAKNREEKAAREKAAADKAAEQLAKAAAEKEEMRGAVADILAERKRWSDAKSNVRVGMTSAQLRALHPRLD
jgi:membrane protein involved in colicin uptake